MGLQGKVRQEKENSLKKEALRGTHRVAEWSIVFSVEILVLNLAEGF